MEYLNKEGFRQFCAKVRKALQRKSNPNLLDNWYFGNPINRRGLTRWDANGVCIDRWRISFNLGGSSLYYSNNYLTMDSESGKGNVILSQNIETDLTGKTITISILTDKELYSVSGEFKNIPLTSVAPGLVMASIESGNIYWYITAGHVLNVVAAKLELGSQQTLAHKEGDTWVLNEIPDYAEEYAKCIQYSPITGAFVGSLHSNPNLLINWYFVGGGSQQGGGQFPINQRGQKEYTNTAGYTIDMWRGWAPTDGCSITENGVKVGSSFLQYVPTLIPGRTYTFSALLYEPDNEQNAGINVAVPYATSGQFFLASSPQKEPGLISLTFTVPNENVSPSTKYPRLAMTWGTYIAAKL